MMKTNARGGGKQRIIKVSRENIATALVGAITDVDHDHLKQVQISRSRPDVGNKPVFGMLAAAAMFLIQIAIFVSCLLYTSDAADE